MLSWSNHQVPLLKGCRRAIASTPKHLGMARDIALHMGLQRLILEVERYIMLVKQVWQNQMRGTTITKVVEELDQVEDGYGSWLCVLMVISHA